MPGVIVSLCTEATQTRIERETARAGAEARQEQHMYPCQKRTLFYRVLARRLCSLPRPGFGCEVSAQTAQSSPVPEEAEGSSFTDSI